MAPRRSKRYAWARTALLAAAAVLAGCGGEDAPDLTAQEVVESTVRQTGAEKSFRFKLEVKNPPRAPSGLFLTFAEGEMRVPDRMQAEIAGTFSGIPLQSELIAIGRDEYLRDPFGGGWRTIDVGVSPLDFFDADTGVLAVLRNARDIELSERDGDYVVTGDVAAQSVEEFLGVEADDRQLDVEVIADEDFRLRRIAVKGPANDDESADVERVVELSDYGTDVDIQPPE